MILQLKIAVQKHLTKESKQDISLYEISASKECAYHFEIAVTGYDKARSRS